MHPSGGPPPRWRSRGTGHLREQIRPERVAKRDAAAGRCDPVTRPAGLFRPCPGPDGHVRRRGARRGFRLRGWALAARAAARNAYVRGPPPPHELFESPGPPAAGTRPPTPATGAQDSGSGTRGRSARARPAARRRARRAGSSSSTLVVATRQPCAVALHPASLVYPQLPTLTFAPVLFANNCPQA